MNSKITEMLKSRKFYAALVAAIIPVLNQELGLHLDPLVITTTVGAIIAWVLGQAHVDNAKIMAAAAVNDTPNVPPVVEEAPKSEVIKALDKQGDDLTEATTALWQIEKSYKDGVVSLQVTLAAIDAWKKQYPTWAGLIPPGFPSV